MNCQSLQVVAALSNNLAHGSTSGGGNGPSRPPGGFLPRQSEPAPSVVRSGQPRRARPKPRFYHPARTDMKLSIALLLFQLFVWVPYTIVSNVIVFSKPAASKQVFLASALLYFFSHMLCLIDPLIYVSLSRRLRAEMAKDLAVAKSMLMPT